MVNECISNMEKTEEIKELLADTLHKQAEIQNIVTTAYLDFLTEKKNVGAEVYPYEADMEKVQKGSEALLHTVKTLEKLFW